MLRQLSQELTIQPVETQSADQVPTAEILREGNASGIRVAGAVLEAAIAWNDYYLIFLSDDIPQEDTLNIHLLDEKLDLLDSVRLGSIYSSGAFSALELIEPNRIGFRFIGDTDWTVELMPKPAFALPFVSEPKGVWRRFGFNRHFIVHGDPKPETSP